MDGELVVKGEALYLAPDGVGAIVGAPPPIGAKVIAAFDPATGTISFDVVEHDRVVGHGAALYDANAAAISFGDPSHPLFHRRLDAFSPATASALGLN